MSITLKPHQVKAYQAKPHVTFNYVSIVEETNLAFLSPLLDAKTRPKRVILVADDHLHTTLHYSKSYLISQGIQCDTWSITSQRGLSYVAQTLMNYLDVESEPLALNMGRSQSVIATVLQHYFLLKKWPVFYCENHCLKSIYPQPKHSQLHPTCTIRDLFTMQMSDLTSFHTLNEFDDYLLEFAQQILQSLIPITDALSIMHRLAMTADYNLQSEKIKGSHLLENKFQQLVEQFEKAGCCDLQKGSVVFANSIHHYLARGGWINLNICQHIFAHPKEFKVYDVLCAVWVENKMIAGDLLYFDSIYIVDDYMYALHILPDLQEDYHEQDQLNLWRLINQYLSQCKLIHARPIMISHTNVPDELKRWSKNLGVRLYDQLDLQNLDIVCSQMFT